MTFLEKQYGLINKIRVSEFLQSNATLETSSSNALNILRRSSRNNDKAASQGQKTFSIKQTVRWTQIF